MSKKLPRELPILGLLIAACALLAVFVPDFRKHDNLTAVGENAAFIGIMACGQALVILGAGLDLSVGSVMAVCSCAMAMLLAGGLPWGYTAVLGLAAGLAAGAFNGILITLRRLPPILTTLATLLLFRHGISIVTHDKAYGPFPDGLDAIGAGWTPVIVFALITLIFTGLCAYTRFGRWTLAIGGSEQSALLSAVPVKRVKMAAYMLSGLCAALAGWIVMAFNNNAQSSVGKGYELDAIAACVVGGIRITGGDGSVAGAAVGACIIALLRDMLTLTGRPDNQSGLFTGAVILVAALIETWRARRSDRAALEACQV